MPELDKDGNPINPDPNVPPSGDPPSGDPPAGDEPSFSKKQMEQLSTLTGRIIKKQFDENVMPLINRREEPVYRPPMNDGADTLKKFNETLQQKIFEGDVLGAMQMAADVQARAKENLSKTQITEANRLITSYADKPFYKDIHSDMDKITKDAIGQGVPPEWAVEHAYQKSLAGHLQGTRSSDGEEGSLGMLGGGAAPRRSKETKLPTEFKDACARDITKGLVKDEKEWISLLSPSIRKQYNI